MSDDLPGTAPVTARRLTAHEVERVLRRAIDLQHAGDIEREPAYTVADVERLGTEIGVPPEAIRTALVQVQHEALVRPRETPGWLDRTFGPEWVVAVRSVPGSRAEVHAATAAMLQEQLYRVARNLGATVVWAPGTGWLDGVRRALDFSQRYRLIADVVIVTVTESLQRAGWSDVRVEAGLAERRSGALRGAIVGPALLGGGSTAVALALGTASVAFAPLILAGLLTSSALVLRSRRHYRQDVEILQQGLERHLDYLERERVP